MLPQEPQVREAAKEDRVLTGKHIQTERQSGTFIECKIIEDDWHEGWAIEGHSTKAVAEHLAIANGKPGVGEEPKLAWAVLTPLAIVECAGD
ncbi:MAG: hypothetical protein R3F43_15890 [bacterium]